MEGCQETTTTDANKEITVFSRDGITVAMRNIDETNPEQCCEHWYRNDELHREGDLPAVIWYKKNGAIIAEYWYRNGKPHRGGDLPADIYYRNNQIYAEYWHRHGKLYRDGGLPVAVWYDKKGAKTEERWYHDNKKHREGGLPAVIRYKNGVKTAEAWYRDAKLYTNGRLAAVIYYNFESIDEYEIGCNTYTIDVQLFRDAVKGDAIHDALRPLPIPIRQAIIPHYCYQ